MYIDQIIIETLEILTKEYVLGIDYLMSMMLSHMIKWTILKIIPFWGILLNCLCTWNYHAIL